MKKCFFIFFLYCTAAHAAPLTLESCKKIAIDQNPLKKAAHFGIGAACEAVEVEKAPFYPHFQFSTRYSRWQTHAFIPTQLQGVPEFQFSRYGPFNDYRVGVEGRYILFDFGKRTADLKAALSRKGIARQEEVKICHEILMNVSVAFYSLAANLEMLKVNEQKLDRAKSHLEIAKKRKEVGAAPAIDVYRAQVEVATATQEVTKFRGVVRIAKGNLNVAMGLTPNIPVEILPRDEEPTHPDTIDIEHSLSLGVQHRPEMKASHCHLQALKYEVNKVRGEFGPNVVVEGAYGRRDESFYPDTREFYAGIGLEWPIFTGFSSVHKLRQQKNEYLHEQARQEQLALTIQQEIWRAHSQLIESYEMINTTLAQLHDANESLRLASERYANGAATLNDLLDTETALSRSEAIHVEARWNYRIAETLFAWTQGMIE